jgi:hypothetical protein
VRAGVVTGLVAVVTALGLLLAALIPFLLSVEGRPLQDYAQPVPAVLSEVGIRILAVLPFVAIPILIAVTGSISRLLGPEGQFLDSVAPPWVSVVALLAWSTLPVVAAIARFRRIDINE